MIYSKYTSIILGQIKSPNSRLKDKIRINIVNKQKLEVELLYSLHFMEEISVGGSNWWINGHLVLKKAKMYNIVKLNLTTEKGIFFGRWRAFKKKTYNGGCI